MRLFIVIMKRLMIGLVGSFFEVLYSRGFPINVLNGLHSCCRSIGVMVNGEDSSYFNTRGLVLTAPWVAAVVSGPDVVQCASSCALGLNSPLLLVAWIAKRYYVAHATTVANRAGERVAQRRAGVF
jgi:hypothetical protein